MRQMEAGPVGNVPQPAPPAQQESTPVVGEPAPAPEPAPEPEPLAPAPEPTPPLPPLAEPEPSASAPEPEPVVEEPAAPEPPAQEEPVPVEEPIPVEEPAAPEPEPAPAPEPEPALAPEPVVNTPAPAPEPTSPPLADPEPPAPAPEPEPEPESEPPVQEEPEPEIPIGERTAVVTVGINYYGQGGELKGCVNDSNNYLEYVSGVLGDRKVASTQLVDTLPKESALYPTRANIEQALTDTVQAAWEGKFANVLFHYSGHGGQVQDFSGDEADKKDETLIPVDYRTAGLITDDWLLEYVINAMPPDVRVFGLIDACHSGTALDLRYKYEGDPLRLKIVNPGSSEFSTAMMISGCKDTQYSYDVWDAQYGATGAMTAAWLQEMKKNRKRPALVIMKEMRKSLSAKGYPQTPQLSSSKDIHTHVQIYALGDFA